MPENSGVVSTNAAQSAEHSTLRIVLALVTLLILCSGIIVFTLADRIIERFIAAETLSEEKEAAMLDAKSRAVLEERPRLTREEKTQFFTIVDFELEDAATEMSAQSTADATHMFASCLPTVKLTTVDREVVWSVSVLGGGGEYTYVWNGDDTLSGTEQLVTKKYSSTGTKSASVTVISAGAINSPLTIPCAEVVRVQSVDVW